jgi:hypothetical protein
VVRDRAILYGRWAWIPRLTVLLPQRLHHWRSLASIRGSTAGLRFAFA